MSRRPYVRAVHPGRWYLAHGRYRVYMLREATCVLVAVYTVLLIAALAALDSGDPEQWRAFLAAQDHWGWRVFHALALVFFVVYQTMAWFSLAPKAMPLRIGARTVPGPMIVAAHYLAWLAISGFVLWRLEVF